MDHVLLLSLLVLLLSDGTVAFCNNSDESIQQQLEDALLSDPCNLNQLKNHFPTGDLPPLTCVPVNYIIQLQQENNTESSDTNATSTYRYLWTTFDTAKNIPGKFLLIWSFRGTLVLGFDWEDSCKFSKSDTIFLYLDGINIDLDLTNETKTLIPEALKNITLKLKTYAETGGNSSQSTGYVREWSEENIHYYYRIVAAIEVGIFILCVLMTISFGPDLINLKAIEDHMRQDIVRDTLWAFLFLAFSWTWIIHQIFVGMNVYDPENQNSFIYNITFINASNLFYLIVAFFIYVDQTKISTETCLLNFLQIVAIAISLSFMTHVFFAFPSIALAFYAFPSRTIIRLGYFELALLCLLVGVAFLFDRVAFLYKELQLSTCKFNRECKCIGDTGICTKKSASVCRAGLQVLSVVLLLVFLSIILIVVGGIVFEATSDAVHTINDYLLILPTVAVNIILLAIHPKEMRNKIIEYLSAGKKPARGGQGTRLGTDHMRTNDHSTDEGDPLLSLEGNASTNPEDT